MKSYLHFLSRNKLYTAIEVAGISVALAFIIPLVSYVSDLWLVNHDNPDYNRIYTFTFYPDYLAGCFDEPEFLTTNIPEVEETTLFSATRPADIKIGEESYSIELLLCDLNFFDFIPTHFVSGNKEVLSDVSSAIVSESFARKAGFGNDAVGKHFVLDNIEYTIEGIVADYNRSLMHPHDVIINIAGPTLHYYWEHPQRIHQKDLCLFRVQRGTDREELLGKIQEAAKVNYAAMYEGYEVQLENSMQLIRYDELTNSHSHTLTNINPFVFRIILILSLILLAFAIFNYIALNVAMGTFRAKEMATRRLLGSSRAGIIGKMLGETFCMTLVCFGAGLLLSYAVLPVINGVFRAASLGFDVRIAYTWQSVCAYVAMIAVVSLISGLVPALIISRSSAIDVVRGEFRSMNKMVFSKVFVFTECMVTVVLLSLSVVYAAQYRKMTNLPLGVDADDVYYLYGPYAHHELDPAVESLRSLPCVEKAGKCDDHPGSVYNEVFVPVDDGDVTRMLRNGNGNMEELQGVSIAKLICTKDAFEAYGFQPLRDFHRDGERVVWLTESCIERLHLNYEDPRLSEEQMSIMGVTTIGGIIPDFRGSYYYDNACFVAVQEDWYESPVAYYKSVAIKTTGPHGEAEKQIMETLRRSLDEAWGIYKEPHTHGFVEELNKESLNRERVMMRAITVFAALMLLLSLLGLTGMSTWYVSLRSHDIAIRKVYGGTVAGETLKNVKTYMLVVLFACLAGTPIAWYFAQELLATYVHRITLTPLIFLAAILVVLLFSAAVVSLQTWRTTRLNPALSLKKE